MNIMEMIDMILSSPVIAAAVSDAVPIVLSFIFGFIVEMFRASNEIKKLKESHNNQLSQMREKYEMDLEQERVQRMDKFFLDMVTAVTEYLNCHNVDYKTRAEAACRVFSALAEGELATSSAKLARLIAASDAFDGPLKGPVEAAIDEIAVNFHKHGGNQ